MIIGPPDHDLFANNVEATLQTMGHETLMAGPARRIVGQGTRIAAASHLALQYSSRLDIHAQRHLPHAAAAYQPNLILSVDRRLRPATVRSLSTSAPVVLWFPDAVSNLDRHEMFLAGYKKIYMKNPLVVQQLREIYGVDVAYLPEACNPLWHSPRGPYGTERTIVVAGNPHPTRLLLLDRLLRAGIPLSIYGSPPPSWIDLPLVKRAHSGRFIFGEEKASTFRRARGVLNNLHPAEFAGSNCRLFESTACGAATMTEWRPGMESLFERDREVLPFATYEQLEILCRRLLNDVTFGREIADAAATRSASEHTYQARLEELLNDLDLA